MKKLLSLIAAVFLIAGCDDGDIEFRTFDFSGETIATCTDNNIFFKINEAEVLILEINPELLVNEVTEDEDGNEVPRTIDITQAGAAKLTYRRYADAINNNNLCGNPIPAYPGVAEEWLGDGELSVTTREIRSDETGILSGYAHEIVISSVTFTKVGEGISQTINNSTFGVIERKFNFDFDFETANEEVEREAVKCDSDDNENNLLYTIKADEALILDFEDGLFESPQTVTLGGFQNPTTLALKIYDGSVSQANICSLDQPISPVVIERWEAISGTLSYVTTTVAGTLEHRIYLKDVIFQNGEETFNINDVVEIPEEDEALGYFYGVYYTAE